MKQLLFRKNKPTFLVIIFFIYSSVVGQSPPVISVVGTSIICQQTNSDTFPIVQSISITDPDDTQLLAVIVQISQNYDVVNDSLALTGTNPLTITDTWDEVTGALRLEGPAVFADFETAISNVVFSSTSTILSAQTREIKITLIEENFLELTGHYYELVAATDITWTDARDNAASMSLYGVTGYLVTFTTPEEFAFIGDIAAAAGVVVAWMGATDEAVEEEWRWVTGPEAGTQFWQGGVIGSTTPPYNYAQWSPNLQPSQSFPDYDYAGFNSAVWGAGDNGGNGGFVDHYMVEYGDINSFPTILTSFTMVGCHRKVISNRHITVKQKNN